MTLELRFFGIDIAIGVGRLTVMLILLLLLSPTLVLAKTPDAELFVNDKLYLASYGDFGSRETFDGFSLSATPSTDHMLCGNGTTGTDLGPAILLVPRGECSFEYKLQRAFSWGASGVIIYNTMESRYKWNDTENTVVYPVPRQDYDCNLGATALQDPPFDLDPPAYNGSKLDRYLKLSSPENYCIFTSQSQSCASERCLITSKETDTDRQAQVFQACCAWDIHVDMSEDQSLVDTTATTEGLAIFVTMAQSDELLQLIGSNVTVQARYYPRFNVSSFILWLLAVAIAAFASWNSASDYRRTRNKFTQMINHSQPQRDPQQVEMTPTPTIVVVPSIPQVSRTQEEALSSRDESLQPYQDHLGAQHRQEEGAVSLASPSPDSQAHASIDQQPQSPELVVSHDVDVAEASNMPPETDHQNTPHVSQSHQRAQAQRSQPRSGESMELTMWHAATFVIVASGLLLLLFFFQFYTAVTVLYGIACSGAMSHFIFRPIFAVAATHLGCSDHANNAICPKVVLCGLGEISGLDVLAGLAGYFIGFTWLVVWFTANDPSSQPYYWTIQNVMGACICILFLKILRLNSMKVATVLLIAVFVYDIFFVFLSPYIFGGESVMVTVATGGGTEVSADYCQKYPSDSQCREGQPLPMLLTIPRINDFRGGSSMLGLGDIVLPGLLISFAARLDEAKYLVGGHTNMRIRMPPKPGGYLMYLVIAYAVGLLLANIAVVVMQQGQPALMYLVPTTLGTFLFLGRHELKDLWQGPRVLVWADRLVRYGDNNNVVHSDDAATAAESVDDVDFDHDHGDGAVPTTGSNQTSHRAERTVGGSARELI